MAGSTMKIALDARPLVVRQMGGTEQRARALVSALVELKADHEYQLMFERVTNSADFDFEFVKALPPNFVAEEIGNFSFPTRFPSASRMLNSLARTINRTGANVYHSFAPMVPRTTVCPVVPTVHDLSFELDPVVRRMVAGRQLRAQTRQSVEYAKRIVAVSSQTKFDIASVYNVEPDEIDVIFNGIDPVFTPDAGLLERGKVHEANDIRGPYVLSVGADIPRRNYARLLTAMQWVWSQGIRVKWVLAGRADWNVSDIYEAARLAGAQDRVRFVASPTNEELVALYRGATITCCASSFEGFGLSVLESMACGTAVACSDMRSLKEVAEDAALYFPHDDAEAIGEAIAGLIEDVEYRRQLKYRGLQRAGMFTWKAGAELTLKTLEDAARK